MNLFLYITRPLICLLIVFILWGIGAGLARVCRRDLNLDHLSKVSLGLVFFTYFIYCLGFINLYSHSIFWLILGLGTVHAAYQLRSTDIDWERYKKSFDDWFIFKGVLLLMFIAIIFVRCNVPVYFIDVCQYHFPIAGEYLRAGGFVHLPHNHFATMHSSFFPEVFYLFSYGLLDDFLTQNLFLAFFILIIFQVYRILKVLGMEKSFYVCLFLMLGTPVIMNHVFYTKPVLIGVLIHFEIIYQFLKHREQPKPILFGVFLSYFLFLKFSFLIIVVFWVIFYLYHLYKKKVGIPIIPALIYFVPLLLLLGKNLVTHGFWGYPFIYDKTGVSLPGVERFFDRSEGASVVEMFIQEFKHLFFTKSLDNFPSYAFFWAVCFSILVLLMRKKFTSFHAFFLAMSLSFWAFLVLTFIFPSHSLRLSMPAWLTLLVLIGAGYASLRNKPLRMLILAASFVYGTMYCYKTILYTPGKSYHLGLETLHESYKKMWFAAGIVGTDPILHERKIDGKIGVFSEYLHSMRHPKVLPVRLSEIYDHPNGFDSMDEVLKQFAEDDIEYLYYQMNSGGYANLDEWIQKMIKTGELDVLLEREGFYLLKNKAYKKLI